MDLVYVVLMYAAGVLLMVAEMFIPGMVIGLVGAAVTVTSIVFGFGHHWAIGAGQTGFALVVVPAAFVWASKRMALKSDLDTSGSMASYTRNYSEYLGKEGEAVTDLRPGGMVRIGDRKVDVVTSGEGVARGRKVRVVRVEGNRVIVRELEDQES